LINVLTLPLYLRDLIFLGHLDPDSPLAGASGGAGGALLAYLSIIAIGMSVLYRRYRWTER
jgi:hypothetical protein